MSRDSELQKEIERVTTNLEEATKEKERVERELMIHDLNMKTVEKIEHLQKALKSSSNKDIAKKGWFFIFGKQRDNDTSYIEFDNEAELRVPNDPNLWDELKDVIYNILEKKKEQLRQE